MQLQIDLAALIDSDGEHEFAAEEMIQLGDAGAFCHPMYEGLKIAKKEKSEFGKLMKLLLEIRSVA